MKKALEVAIYKLKNGVSDADYINAVAEADEHFINKQKGFISHTFAKDLARSEWIDVLRWETMEDATAASKAAMQSPACAPMFGMIDESSITMRHFSIVKEI